MEIHVNYAKFEEENPTAKNHVDKMYKLVNEYAKENGITLNYGDIAEHFVEAIATYIVDSETHEQKNKKATTIIQN